MNRVVWRKSVSAKDKRNEVIISVLTCGLQSTHTHTHTQNPHFINNSNNSAPPYFSPVHRPSLLSSVLLSLSPTLCPDSNSCSVYSCGVFCLPTSTSPCQALHNSSKLPPPSFISVCFSFSYKWNPTITFITVISLLLTSLLRSLAPIPLPTLLLFHFFCLPPTLSPPLERTRL